MAKRTEPAQGEAAPVRRRRKLSAKQIAFAEAFIETGIARQAYLTAYKAKNMSDVAIAVEANKLLNHPKISLLIEEGRKRNAKRHEITVQTLTDGYLEAAEIARTTQQATALTGAYTALGKLHGLIVEKTENKHEYTLSEEFEGFIRQLNDRRRGVSHESVQVIEHDVE